MPVSWRSQSHSTVSCTPQHECHEGLAFQAHCPKPCLPRWVQLPNVHSQEWDKCGGNNDLYVSPNVRVSVLSDSDNVTKSAGQVSQAILHVQSLLPTALPSRWLEPRSSAAANVQVSLQVLRVSFVSQ